MKTLWTTLVIAAVAASGQSQTASVIYAGDKKASDQKIRLRAWGSGAIAETAEGGYQGPNAVRISTRNYYQGGMLILGEPIDLAKEYEDKNNLLRITYKIEAGAAATTPGQARPATPAGPSRGGVVGGDGAGRLTLGPINPLGLISPSMGIGFQRGGIPGMGGRPSGAQPQPAQGGAPQAIQFQIKALRLIVTTSDGLRSEAYIPTSSSYLEKGWRSTAIPLQAINGIERTNKVVTEIALSADANSTILIGEMKVVSDRTPITGEVPYTTLNLGFGDTVELRANGYGGSTALKFLWDFDSNDGIQEEAEGQVIRRTFRKAGTFTVTVTIADKYGLKEPFQTSFRVKVNP